MPSSVRLPALKTIKLQAKRLRQILAEQGTPLSHSQSLEIIAKQWGYSDWNTLNAILKTPDSPENLTIGDIVTGYYMGEPVEAEVLRVQTLGHGDAFNLTLKLDKRVDVINSEGEMSSKKKVRCTVGVTGKTVQKMADGTPHFVLDV